MTDDCPTLDLDDAASWIADRTGIPAETCASVLAAETDYMQEQGITEDGPHYRDQTVEEPS